MDKIFLKEKKLYEAHKQFMRLCEWSYVPQNLEEDNDEQDDMVQQDDDSQMSNDSGIGTDQNNIMGSDDSMTMGDQQGVDANNDNSIVDNGENADSMPMDTTQQNQEMPQINDTIDNDINSEEEDVIDVDDITNAQEKMNTKVNHVGLELGDVDDKITTLLKSLSKMEQMIDNNNQEIAKFKQEFEKRNPTQTEKLNLRSLDSYPFNVNPKDYWEEKGIDPNSNYSNHSDNDKSTTDEYEITNNDIDDFSERDIEDSFDIDDDLNQDIKKIFGL